MKRAGQQMPVIKQVISGLTISQLGSTPVMRAKHLSVEVNGNFWKGHANVHVLVPTIQTRALLIASYIALLIIWLAFWIIPWQPLVADLPWLSTVIALLMFIVPGACVDQLFKAEAASGPSLPVGFAISVGLTGLFGLLARLIHLPISAVIGALITTGVIMLAALIYRALQAGPETTDRIQLPLGSGILVLPAALLAAVLITSLVSEHYGLDDDDTYIAYLTHWQHAESLDFREIYFHESIDSARFWFSQFPMVTAILASASHLHGMLLVKLYLGPVLALLALLAVYELARALGLSPFIACLALIAQVVVLCLLMDGKNRPGSVFLLRLTEDKVLAAYILAPVLLRKIVHFTDAPSRRSWLSIVLAGLSLTFTHPVILAFVSVISGFYMMLDWILERRRKPALAVLLALVILLMLPAPLRFLPHWSVTYRKFNVELEEDEVSTSKRLNIIGTGPLYGFSPELLLADSSKVHPIIVYAPLAIISLGTLTAVFSLRRSRAARFLLASTTFLLIGLFPLTGWILGYFVAATQIWRVPWMTPFGIAFAYALHYILTVSQEANSHRMRLSAWGSLLTAVAACYLLVGISAIIQVPSLHENDEERRDLIEDLVAIGYTIDAQGPDRSVTIGTLEINRFLAGISPHVQIVFPRHSGELVRHGMAEAEAEARANDWYAMIADNTSQAERLDLLAHYDVRFIVAEDETQWAEMLVQEHPDQFRLAARHGSLTLYERLPQ
jgi:hypothetical protein